MALVLAVMMVLGVATAFAADGDSETPTTYTITITKDSTDKAAHTYGAFQIFSGDLNEAEGKKVLSNIEWGTGIDSAKVSTLISAINTALGLAEDKLLAANASAAKVAEVISDQNIAKDDAKAKALANAFEAALVATTTYSGTVAAEAKQATISNVPAGYYLVKDTAAVTGEGAQTRYMLEVVSNVAPTEKANVPTVEKKVKDINDSTETTVGSWQDSADYDVGDVIPYKITGSLPSDFADYKTYKKYKFTDTLSSGLTITSEQLAAVTVTIGAGGTSIKDNFDVSLSGQVLTVSLKDGKDLKTISEIDKDSKIVVAYNATLNDQAVIGKVGNDNKVTLEFTNNPNNEGDGDKGTTPEDKVIVFTYKIDVDKITADGDPLPGAGFTLYKYNASSTAEDKWEAVKPEVVITSETNFSWDRIDDGKYKLVETTTPAGYNTIDPIEFEITATHDATADTPTLTGLTVTDGKGFAASLDAGTFTKVHKTNGTADARATVSGEIAGEVINNSGATLPSTGGVGTQMFYIGGGLLALVAVVLLVTKRRMTAE